MLNPNKCLVFHSRPFYIPCGGGNSKHSPRTEMIDVRDHEDALDAINSVINNDKIAEIKVEKNRRDGTVTIFVLAHIRSIKFRKNIQD